MTVDQKNETLELVVPSDVQSAVVDVAADVGNARTIVLVRDGDTTHEITLPSVRSLRDAFSFRIFAARNLPRDSWQNLAADEHVIAFDGVERFLGRLALEYAAVASTGRGSDARYYDGTVLDFVLAGVAAALPRTRQITIRQLAIVVPISLWDQIAVHVERSLRGKHEYTYNGREMRTKVEHVVVMREGAIAYKALSSQPAGKVLIIDGGGRTHNIALCLDGEYRKGATIELGVDAALDDVDNELIGLGHAPLSLADRLQLLDAMLVGSPYSYRSRGASWRVDHIARKRFDVTARALVDELHSKVNVGAAEHLFYIGGAAYPAFFGDKVRELLLECNVGLTLETEPETRNARAALLQLGGSLGKVKKARARK